MRPHDISCRCCQERYNSTEHGCDICLPAKKNIVWPEVELPILESILGQSLRIVAALAEDLEYEMKEARKKRGRALYFDHVKAAKILTDANTTLVGEARKLRKEEAQVAQNLSWDQKIELMLGALEDMPDEQQAVFLRRIHGRLQAAEAKLITDG